MSDQEIFQAALSRPSGSARAAYLEEACGTDIACRQRVEALLREQESSSASKITAGYEPSDKMAVPPSTARDEYYLGKIIGGRYKLLQPLGEGGMGTVYLAEQFEPIVRQVAIKVIKPGMDSSAVLARFEAERQALALMDHPHIAKVLDAGATSEQRPYFVMELVKGIPITRFCDQQHMSPRERLELFLLVCDATQHAHQKGIIHRDLKPSNVLVTLSDGKPTPKVIDFGVAKATSRKLTERTLYTEVGQMVGTPEYMAPEQADLNNLDIDTRADIYSLGVILYELLAGSPPFTSKQLRGAAFTEMLRIIREVEPPKPSTKLSTAEELPSIAANRHYEPKRLTRLLSGDLDWIIMKTLEKDRTRRYDSASSLALDIQHYLSHEPVAAGPPSALYRLRKFVKRNRRGTLSAAIVLAALILGLVGTAWGLYQAQAANKEALQQRDEASQAREAAEKNARAARSVIDQFLIRIGDDQLSAIPQFEKVRRDLVDLAVKRYRELLAMQPDNPELRLDAGTAYQRSANLYRMMNQLAQAQPLYEEAIELLRGTPHRAMLSSILSDFGDFLTKKEGADAASAAYEQAIALGRALVKEQPQNPAYQLALAKALSNWGSISRNSKGSTALSHLKESAQIFSELAQDLQSNPQAPLLAAFAWTNVAQAARESGSYEQMQSALAESLRRGEQLIVRTNNNPNARYILAWCKLENALGQLQQKKFSEAMPDLNQALEMTANLQQEFPKVASFRRKHAEALTARGQAFLLQQQFADGTRDALGAITALEQLDRETTDAAQYQSYLAQAYKIAGECALRQKDTKTAQRRFEQAHTCYVKALAVNPANTLLLKQSEENQALLKPLSGAAQP